MVKIMIEVEIPDYEIKYCDDVWYGSRCKWLQKYDYGFKCYYKLTMKDITKISNSGDKVHRPYGCRCIAKHQNKI